MGRKKRCRISLVVQVNIDHSPRHYANWLDRAVRAQTVLRSIRRTDPGFLCALREQGLGRLNLAICALDLMVSVVANGRLQIPVDGPEVKPILMLKALGFLRGDGTDLVLEQPTVLTKRAVRSALKRLPDLVVYTRRPGLAKIIQLQQAARTRTSRWASMTFASDGMLDPKILHEH